MQSRTLITKINTSLLVYISILWVFLRLGFKATERNESVIYWYLSCECWLPMWLFPQRKGPAKAADCQKAKPTAAVQLAPPVQVQAPADPLPPVTEVSADVSMKEEELCQAFSEALLTVQDVDEHDSDMPQLCSEYVKDIYNYLHVLEVIYPQLSQTSLNFQYVCLYSWMLPQAVGANYMQGYEITEHMPALLIFYLLLGFYKLLFWVLFSASRMKQVCTCWFGEHLAA